MNEMMKKLWNDDAGFILSAEAVFLFTIMVLGVTVGMVAVRNATVGGLVGVANAISSINTSYSYTGFSTCGATTSGSSYSGSPFIAGFSSIAAPTSNAPVGVCP